jgi:predicted nucleotidyltransferase
MFDVELFEPEIVELCRRARVRRLELIGPAAASDCTEADEVDVLVRFQHTDGGLFNRFFDLKEGLERVFGRMVDVTVANTIHDPAIWKTIEHSRRTIFAA